MVWFVFLRLSWWKIAIRCIMSPKHASDVVVVVLHSRSRGAVLLGWGGIRDAPVPLDWSGLVSTMVM